jgi:CDP-glycerol glycerophosphotransferase
MPRVSVVVPVYDVERYVAGCLQSLARQTFADLEVIMVDDGSTDSSAAIAERFAERDERFRLLRQANGGLGKARNTGLAAASGEFVAFVDSDDIVPDGAYERMVRSLDESGSDFATGNVQRLTPQGTSQAQFLARAFARDRPRTHVTRFRPLLADRTAWNKLWRRSFWEEHAFKFPEGVIHEDIPVTIPAHLAATRVDVIAAPVYQWRLRDDGGRSITQGRLEHRVLRDRLAAIEQVRKHLAERGPRKLCRWYDASLLSDDLRLHLVLLDRADAAYRAMFMEGSQPILGAVSPRTLRGLRAIDRLMWHLVRRGLEDELLEVVRFHNERRDARRVVRRNLAYYGDFPFREDRRLRIPRSIFRLGRGDEELSLVACIDELNLRDEALRLGGRAHVRGLDAPGLRSQRTTAIALKPGRWQALRLRISPPRLPTRAVHRPELASDGARGRDLSWSGFEAVLDAKALRGRGGWREGGWKVFLHTRAGLVRRRRGRFQLSSPELIGAVELPSPADVRARAIVTSEGAVTLEVTPHWARLSGPPEAHAEDIELRLEARASLGQAPRLRLKRRSDAFDLTYPLARSNGDAPSRLDARVPLSDLIEAPTSLEAWASGGDEPEMWDVYVDGGERPLAVALSEDFAGAVWRSDARQLALIRTPRGDAAIVTSPRTFAGSRAPN